MPYRLINWNVRNAGEKQVHNNVDWLLQQNADIWLLSEVNYRHCALWQSLIKPHRFTLVYAHGEPEARGAIIASRLPITPLPPLFEHGFGNALTVSATVDFGPKGMAELHAAYCPPDASKETNGWRKQHILSALFNGLAERGPNQILGGDFNAPQAEEPDGHWISFAETFSKARGEWYFPDYKVDAKLKSHKRDMEKQLRQPRADMACTFQRCKRQGSPSVSWRHYRLDHIIASETMMPDEVWYTTYLPQGADHRPMFADWK